MKKIDVEIYPAQNLEEDKLEQLIKDKRSFNITDVKEMSVLIQNIENLMESNGLKVRVSTKKRALASIATGVTATGLIAGSIVFAPVGAAAGVVAITAAATGITSAATATSIGVHNLATFNPDYTILKNPITSTVTVRYMKKI